MQSCDNLGSGCNHQAGERFNPYKMFPGSYIPEPVSKYKGISPGAKVVYGRLERYAGKDGLAWPGMATLGAECGLSEATARRYVKELREKGFIEYSDTDKHYAPDGSGGTYNVHFLWHPAFEGDPGQPRKDFRVRHKAASHSFTNVNPPGEVHKCEPAPLQIPEPQGVHKCEPKESPVKDSPAKQSLSLRAPAPKNYAQDSRLKDLAVRRVETPVLRNDVFVDAGTMIGNPPEKNNLSDPVLRSPEDIKRMRDWMHEAFSAPQPPREEYVRELLELAPAWTVSQVMQAFNTNSQERGGIPNTYSWFAKVLKDIYKRWNAIPPQVTENHSSFYRACDYHPSF